MKIEHYISIIGFIGILVIGFIIFAETNKKYIKKRNIRYKNIDFTKAPNKEEYEVIGKNVSEMTRKELRICERFYNRVDNPKMVKKIREEREKRNSFEFGLKKRGYVIVGERIKPKKKLDFVTHKVHKKEFAKQRRKQERAIGNK